MLVLRLGFLFLQMATVLLRHMCCFVLLLLTTYSVREREEPNSLILLKMATDVVLPRMAAVNILVKFVIAKMATGIVFPNVSKMATVCMVYSLMCLSLEKKF